MAISYDRATNGRSPQPLSGRGGVQKGRFAAMELLIRDVAKTYANGVQALKNVSLTIPVGMYGLLGPNGSGKSTLMRTIATLQEPDTGSIRLGEIDVLHECVS